MLCFGLNPGPQDCRRRWISVLICTCMQGHGLYAAACRPTMSSSFLLDVLFVGLDIPRCLSTTPHLINRTIITLIYDHTCASHF